MKPQVAIVIAMALATTSAGDAFGQRRPMPTGKEAGAFGKKVEQSSVQMGECAKALINKGAWESEKPDVLQLSIAVSTLRANSLHLSSLAIIHEGTDSRDQRAYVQDIAMTFGNTINMYAKVSEENIARLAESTADPDVKRVARTVSDLQKESRRLWTIQAP